MSIYDGGQMATGAQIIDYGGETDGISSRQAMGSGQPAAAGRGDAAYHRNICYVAPGRAGTGTRGSSRSNAIGRSTPRPARR